MHYTILVLNDGETYTDVSGCEILTVNEHGMEILDNGGDPADLQSEDIVMSIRLEGKDYE
jgi:hypothetical protein